MVLVGDAGTGMPKWYVSLEMDMGKRMVKKHGSQCILLQDYPLNFSSSLLSNWRN